MTIHLPSLLVEHGDNLVRFGLRLLPVDANGPLEQGLVPVELRLDAVHERDFTATPNLIRLTEIIPVELALTVHYRPPAVWQLECKGGTRDGVRNLLRWSACGSRCSRAGTVDGVRGAVAVGGRVRVRLGASSDNVGVSRLASLTVDDFHVELLARVHRHGQHGESGKAETHAEKDITIGC